MNLYSQKQRWKLVLLFAALVICGISIWYASYIANQVRKAESQRVNNWGETIQKKAGLVKITNEAFIAKAKDDVEKVKLWVDATQEMQKDLLDYSFALKIIQNNDDIPLILTENNNFSSVKNLTEAQQHPDSIARYMADWSKQNPPIEIKYANNKSQKIYYRYSDTYYQLQSKRNAIIKSFNDDLVENSDLVPVLFLDSATGDIIATNLDSNLVNSPSKLKSEISLMTKEKITIQLDDNVTGILYYKESDTLTQLRYYPYIMLSIIALFALVSYLLFSTFRRAEQNQVWVGMAKETAHQLGTPLSSLMAWVELLRAEGVSEDYLIEMNKDISRLVTVTDRFSKIGSETKLEEHNISSEVEQAMDYLCKRVSSKVSFVYDNKAADTICRINKPLFNWVIENIVKNAVDAMEGEGTLTTSIYYIGEFISIEISDTGKGISATKLKTVFEPGYTTKKRGWGLGLSLAKRIIEEHHKGKISVKSTEAGKGTTFLIQLPVVSE
jgi:two-component system, sporulation sensor kinase D